MLQLQSTSPLQAAVFLEFTRFIHVIELFARVVSICKHALVQVGVVEAFRQQAQIVEVSKAGGSSAGALVAAAMLTGLPMESVMVQVVFLTTQQD